MKEAIERIKTLRELEDQLMTAGPARAEVIYRKQNAIQESYYDDVSDLLEQIEDRSKQIERVIAELEQRKMNSRLDNWEFGWTSGINLAITKLKAVLHGEDERSRVSGNDGQTQEQIQSETDNG